MTDADMLRAVLMRDARLDRLSADEEKKARRRVAELIALILAMLEASDVDRAVRLATKRARVEALVRLIRSEIVDAYGDRLGLSRAALRQIARTEWRAAEAMLEAEGRGDIAAEIGAAIDRALVDGMTVDDLYLRAGAALMASIERILKESYLVARRDNLDAHRIVRDELAQLAAGQGSAAAAAAVAAIANEARMGAFLAAGMGGVVWVAIRDRKTCVRCAALSGKAWSLPEFQPIRHDVPWPSPPPLHPRCRCSLLPFTGEAPEVPGDYGDWLRGESETTQNEILGRRRAEMLRAGEITDLSELIDQSTRPLRLDEFTAAP